jgi:surface antigen
MTRSLLAPAMLPIVVMAHASVAVADDCHHDNRVKGTILGAIAGGVIGGAVGHGSGGAVVGGLILGGLAGNVIAGDIDCDDRPYAYRTYRESLNGDIGRRYDWDHRGHHGYIVSTREFWRDGRRCRDFMVVTYRRNDENRHHGTACRSRDGDWRFV